MYIKWNYANTSNTDTLKCPRIHLILFQLIGIHKLSLKLLWFFLSRKLRFKNVIWKRNDYWLKNARKLANLVFFLHLGTCSSNLTCLWRRQCARTAGNTPICLSPKDGETNASSETEMKPEKQSFFFILFGIKNILNWSIMKILLSILCVSDHVCVS